MQKYTFVVIIPFLLKAKKYFTIATNMELNSFNPLVPRVVLEKPDFFGGFFYKNSFYSNYGNY